MLVLRLIDMFLALNLHEGHGQVEGDEALGVVVAESES
jgi:hypothetical protein